MKALQKTVTSFKVLSVSVLTNNLMSFRKFSSYSRLVLKKGSRKERWRMAGDLYNG